jgi:hypothetical protein
MVATTGVAVAGIGVGSGVGNAVAVGSGVAVGTTSIVGDGSGVAAGKMVNGIGVDDTAADGEVPSGSSSPPIHVKP